MLLLSDIFRGFKEKYTSYCLTICIFLLGKHFAVSHCIRQLCNSYIFNRGADASEANFLKKALDPGNVTDSIRETLTMRGSLKTSPKRELTLSEIANEGASLGFSLTNNFFAVN